jgi:orotate phosphoribosyltransferase
MMIIDEPFARELSLDLLKINAVLLQPNDPFTWASGWKAPIYCDNRLTMRYPEIRRKIARHFTRFLQQEFPKTEVIVGTSTSGIPHAAWIASSMDKPMAYVRATKKAHGLGNQIEGGIEQGDLTVVIEDLISTGGSSASVVDALKFAGAEVQSVLSIFTYGFDQSEQQFTDKNVPLYSLADYSTLIKVAEKHHYIDEKDLETLANWRKHPAKWPKY